jgi:hypothetical protein
VPRLGAIAAAGVNVRGTTAVAAGTTSVAYIGFDAADDASRAAAAIKKAGVGKKAAAIKKAGAGKKAVAIKKAGAGKKAGKKR